MVLYLECLRTSNHSQAKEDLIETLREQLADSARRLEHMESLMALEASQTHAALPSLPESQSFVVEGCKSEISTSDVASVGALLQSPSQPLPRVPSGGVLPARAACVPCCCAPATATEKAAARSAICPGCQEHLAALETMHRTLQEACRLHGLPDAQPQVAVGSFPAMVEAAEQLVGQLTELRQALADATGQREPSIADQEIQANTSHHSAQAVAADANTEACLKPALAAPVAAVVDLAEVQALHSSLAALRSQLAATQVQLANAQDELTAARSQAQSQAAQLAAAQSSAQLTASAKAEQSALEAAVERLKMELSQAASSAEAAAAMHAASEAQVVDKLAACRRELQDCQKALGSAQAELGRTGEALARAQEKAGAQKLAVEAKQAACDQLSEAQNRLVQQQTMAQQVQQQLEHQLSELFQKLQTQDALSTELTGRVRDVQARAEAAEQNAAAADNRLRQVSQQASDACEEERKSVTAAIGKLAVANAASQEAKEALHQATSEVQRLQALLVSQQAASDASNAQLLSAAAHIAGLERRVECMHEAARQVQLDRAEAMGQFAAAAALARQLRSEAQDWRQRLEATVEQKDR